jgi:hypothetical protein
VSTSQTVKFGAQTWQKGTRGLLSPHATDKCRIENMRFYDDGSLGPRPLWLADDTEFDVKFGANAKIFPARYNYGDGAAPQTEGYFIVEGADWEYYRDGTSTAYAEFTGSLTFAGDEHSSLSQIDDENWLLDEYLITLAGPAPATPKTIDVTDVGAAIDTKFGGGDNIQCRGSVIHQGRAFYYGPMFSGTAYDFSNRFYYSDPYNAAGHGYGVFTSAEQFIDVDGVIKGMTSIGANLFIWTEEGEWYMLQGRGDPSLGTLNSLGKGRIPGQNRFATRHDRKAMFLSSDTQTIVTLNEGGGFDEDALSYLGGDTTAVPYNEDAPGAMAISSLQNSILQPFYLSTLARHRYNGVWADEAWGVTTYGAFVVATSEYLEREHLIVRVQGASTLWTVYKRQITQDSPNSSGGGAWAEYAETENMELDLPRLSDPVRQVRVKRIVIDARTWESTGTFWPSAAMTVKVEDGKGNLNTLVLGPDSQPLSGVDDVANSPIRIVATPTEMLPYTHFSDVQFSAMIGVAIENVSVELEISEGPIQ